MMPNYVILFDAKFTTLLIQQLWPQPSTFGSHSLQKRPSPTRSCVLFARQHIEAESLSYDCLVASTRFDKKPSGTSNGMMHLSIFNFVLFSTSVFASPIVNRAGAGGPIAKPIPFTCNITNPLPHSNCSTTTTISGYKTASTFASNHALYESYFDLSTPAEELWEQCSQQCYGYGDGGECKSVILAYDVPTPKGYYGGSGGKLMIACLLFDDFLAPDVFEAAPEGQWLDVRAGNLHCEH